jgi:hypothetical protein
MMMEILLLCISLFFIVSSCGCLVINSTWVVDDDNDICKSSKFFLLATTEKHVSKNRGKKRNGERAGGKEAFSIPRVGLLDCELGQ